MFERLIRWRRAVLAGIIVLCVASGALLLTPGMRRDYSLQAFIAGENDDYRGFVDTMREFTSNELALVAVRSRERSPEAGDPGEAPQAALVSKLVSRLREVPCVEQVGAWTELPWLLRTTLGPTLLRHPFVEGNLVSRDGRTSAIVLQMSGEAPQRSQLAGTREDGVKGGPQARDDQGMASGASASDAPGDAAQRRHSGEQRRHVVERLRAIVSEARAENPNVEIIIAGPYVTLIDMYASVDRDLVRFSLAAFALMGAMLALVLRGLRGVLVTLGAGIAAVVTALAVAVVVDASVALVVQMVVILIMVLAVGNGVQLAVDFEECAVEASAPGARVGTGGVALRMLRRMGAPCLVAMGTTLVGFGSLCISELTPIRTFGLLMALGLALGLLMGLGLAPMLSSPRGARPLPGWEQWLGGALARLTDRVVRWRGMTLAIHLLAAGIAGWGATRLRFESDFVRNFRPASEVRRSYEFVEAHLTPLGAIDVVARRRDGASVLEVETLQRQREFARRAVEECSHVVRKAMTLTDLLDPLPDWPLRHAWEIVPRMAAANVLIGDDGLRNFINQDRTALRMNLRAVEGVSVQEKIRTAQRLRAIAAEVFGGEFDVTVTGLYPFYASLVAGLVRDQYASFALTAAVIFLVFLAGLHSLKLACVAMVPNLLPVAACMGAMGWFGVPINMTTILMLSVVLGISVDSTAHYLWRGREIFRASGDYEYALRQASRGIGRACVFTGVVVTVGFWILTLSEFLPTAYFGGLTGFTLLWALAADLTLLPALVRMAKALGQPATAGDRG